MPGRPRVSGLGGGDGGERSAGWRRDHPAPTYTDFAYLALTIGMTYQVSDTSIASKPIRRTALRLHDVLFGTVVVVMMINVVAGLFKR